jgi:hypothetical protein
MLEHQFVEVKLKRTIVRENAEIVGSETQADHDAGYPAKSVLNCLLQVTNRFPGDTKTNRDRLPVPCWIRAILVLRS